MKLDVGWHKLRIVAQGFTQKFGTNYDEVFAPVAKQLTFRTLLTVACQTNSKVKHRDVKTAYLYGVEEQSKCANPRDMFVEASEWYAV